MQYVKYQKCDNVKKREKTVKNWPIPKNKKKWYLVLSMQENHILTRKNAKKIKIQFSRKERIKKHSFFSDTKLTKLREK